MYRQGVPRYLVDDAYGASVPTFATVGVASATFLSQNLRRKGVLFVNTSANMIYLTKGESPGVVGSGIPLYPNGGHYGEPDNLGRVWLGVWNAIASVAGSNLAITEDW